MPGCEQTGVGCAWKYGLEFWVLGTLSQLLGGGSATLLLARCVLTSLLPVVASVKRSLRAVEPGLMVYIILQEARTSPGAEVHEAGTVVSLLAPGLLCPWPYIAPGERTCALAVPPARSRGGA